MNNSEKQHSYVSKSSKNGNIHIDEYAFDYFIVGASNKFAYAAVLAVAEADAKKLYNPLIIYGNHGLGKTHLLCAIRHNAVEKHPHLKVILVKCEDFIDEIVSAIQKGELNEFRKRYQTVDMLLIDDIDYLKGKSATQDELLRIIIALLELGKQVVLTSCQSPNKIQNSLGSPLYARLAAGLLAEIKPPDNALCIAIIKSKAEQLGTILPNDVINYIAENFSSNIRTMEGAVKSTIAYRDFIDEDISIESVQEHLGHLIDG
ncbi:MAG: DnaA/Hda family protein [Oscillospiraceae bacterium]|nr:DnaA/Hda family protein [Oscillospiraceae bacterium]